MILDVKMPMFDVNDEKAILSEFFVSEGQYVERGAPICAIETSKAVNELTAEKSGYIRGISCKEGDAISLNETICFIVESPDQQVEKKVSKKQLSGTFSVTQRAENLAKELGVDLAKLDVKGVIREKDVRSYADSLNKSVEHESKDKLNEIRPEKLKEIQNNAGYKDLSSEEKVAFYKSAGASIGSKVKIGAGSVILAKKILIEDEVSIGENVYIEADELILRKMVTVGSNGNFVCGRINVGDVTTVAENVVIDLSGGKTNFSKVDIGKQCLVGREAYLNASRSIEVGDRTALSPRAIVYTHSFWQSVFDGYQVNFGDVIIGEDTWIGSAAQVLPKVTVGKGSIVISNSLVSTNVAPFTMVGGVPAVVVKKGIKKELSVNAKKGILADLIQEFAASAKEKGLTVDIADKKEYFELKEGNSTVYVGFGLDKVKTGGAVFDIEKNKFSGDESAFTDELRNFLRRRGILFEPIHWRYEIKKGF